LIMHDKKKKKARSFVFHEGKGEKGGDGVGCEVGRDVETVAQNKAQGKGRTIRNDQGFAARERNTRGHRKKKKKNVAVLRHFAGG